MKVFVGGKIYDSEKEAIAVILSPEDRLHIIAMPPDATIYASAPEGTIADDIQKFQYALNDAIKGQTDHSDDGPQEES